MRAASPATPSTDDKAAVAAAAAVLPEEAAGHNPPASGAGGLLAQAVLESQGPRPQYADFGAVPTNNPWAAK